MTTNLQRLQLDILRLIRERKFEAGERLFSERDLAEKFSATRAAVREAVTALEALRIVERRPQSGLFLRNVHYDSSIDALLLEAQIGLDKKTKAISDAIELRGILEINAVQLAAKRREDSDLVEIKAILDTCDDMLSQGQTIELEDARFHKKIVASARNAPLLRVSNWYYEFTKEPRQKYFKDFTRARSSHAQHIEIYHALQAGDPDACAALMRTHMSLTLDLWTRMLEGDAF